MPAMIVIMRTKYGCNLGSETDYICLQSFSIVTKYACNVGNRPLELRDYNGCISRKQNFDDCKHIWSLSKKIASIYGPLRI